MAQRARLTPASRRWGIIQLPLPRLAPPQAQQTQALRSAIACARPELPAAQEQMHHPEPTAKTAPPAYRYRLATAPISPPTTVEEEAVAAEVNTIAQSQSAQCTCPAPEEASAAEVALMLVRPVQERPTLVAVVAVVAEATETAQTAARDL